MSLENEIDRKIQRKLRDIQREFPTMPKEVALMEVYQELLKEIEERKLKRALEKYL